MRKATAEAAGTECANKLSGVQNYVSELENGTHKFPAKALRSEILAAQANALDFMSKYLERVRADVGGYLQGYTEAMTEIEFPPLDQAAALPSARA